MGGLRGLNLLRIERRHDEVEGKPSNINRKDRDVLGFLRPGLISRTEAGVTAHYTP